MEIDHGAEKVLRTLEEAGYEAFIVGGCVRDALMGREPDDWDITTSALPEEVKDLFRKTFDTGIEHGTVTVLEEGGSYEVTTYRVDGEYTDHRRPDTVRFAASLYEDVARRDFTINAMAYHPSVGLKDYFEGTEDLKRQLIRCVGDPSQRFREDALRMLRAVRFSAKLNFTIDETTFKAIASLAPTLENVSKERILEELTKTLLSDHPEKLIQAAETGLMRCFVSKAPEGMKDGSMADFVSPGKVRKDRILRFAAWLHHMDAAEIDVYLRQLKSDNDLRKNVCHLVKHLEDPAPENEKQMRLFLHEVGKEAAVDLIRLRNAVQKDNDGVSERLLALYEMTKEAPVTIKELTVNGRTLMKEGGAEGRAIGEALEHLLQVVLEDPSKNTEEVLLTIYREGYSSLSGENYE